MSVRIEDLLHSLSTEKRNELLVLYERLFEISPDGFLFVDPEGKIVYINPAYCYQLDVKRSDAIGRPVTEVVKNTALVARMENRDFTVERNVLWETLPGQFKTKEPYVIVTRCVVPDKDGNILGAIGQVKFINETLKLADVLNNMSDELKFYKEELNRLGSDHYTFENIIGSSPELCRVKALARKAAQNDFTVLLTGETGTGKEVFAHAIHYASGRRNRPFVRINCAAIPHELFESELFGYFEGAFTGARKGGKKGKIELANGGTLFLDEIGDMPLSMQVKLLRVLQEREIEILGGEQTLPIDIRVIAATNKDLPQEISQGRFREDLYYRLNVISLDIPPMRQRKSDIQIFIDHFLREINQQYQTAASFSPEAIRALESYPWPGNVRELKNAVERSYTMADGGLIQETHLPPHIVTRVSCSLSSGPQTLAHAVQTVEKTFIQKALWQYHYNIKQTADHLGIHRSTLYNKMDYYGIKREPG